MGEWAVQKSDQEEKLSGEAKIQNPMVKTYRDLVVWQRGMDLVEECYRLTRKFPVEERYGLSAQLQRAAVSIPSNIAEGHGRRHRGDFLRQLSIASGSVKEVETQALISVRLGYVGAKDLENLMQLCESIGKMLAGLIRKLSEKTSA